MRRGKEILSGLKVVHHSFTAALRTACEPSLKRRLACIAADRFQCTAVGFQNGVGLQADATPYVDGRERGETPWTEVVG